MLKQTITDNMKLAMKAREMEKLTVLRSMLSEIKNYEIDNGDQGDEGVLKVVAKMVKQVRESIVEYEKGGRQDLVAEEKLKLAVLEEYLPKQMSDDELRKIVAEVIANTENKAMGPIVGQVMKKVAGVADGGRVSKMVQELL